MIMEKETALIDNGNIHGITKFSIFLLMTVGFNPDWSSIGLVWWGVVAFSLVTMILIILQKPVPVINSFTIWMLIFFIWCTASYFWALTPEFSFDIIKGLFINTAVLWPISCIIQGKEDIKELFKLIVYAITVNAAYILSFTDLSLIGQVQIGFDTLGEGWNANSIGIMMAFASVISLVLVKTENKKYRKVLYYLIIILSTAIALFSGSRKALFFVLFGCTMYMFITISSSNIVKFIKLFAFLAATYYAVMKIPMLYNVLGSRLEGLFAYFTGNGKADDSTILRELYIGYGIDWFKKKPILGYGIDNFRVLLEGAIGRETYSHNNYVELLVDVGVIGTFIYYAGYFYIINNITSLALKQKQPIFAVTFVMILSILIAQYGLVTYSDFLIHLFLCIGFAEIRIRGMGDVENLAKNSV